MFRSEEELKKCSSIESLALHSVACIVCSNGMKHSLVVSETFSTTLYEMVHLQYVLK